MNAYDLAEWSTLHPASQIGLIGTWTSLLLRIPLACLAIMTYLIIACRTKQTTSIIILLVLSAGLLPPVEFFVSRVYDLNYLQQFMIAGSTLFISLFCFQQPVLRNVNHLLVLMAVIALMTNLLGQLITYSLISTIRIQSQLGLGAVLFPLILVLFIYGVSRVEVAKKQGSGHYPV